jgi:hypothetical protein
MKASVSMTALFDYLKTNPAAATAVISAFIVLCGVAISAFVAFTTGRRSVYISSVTAERSKWIEKLRANIADLIGLCSAIHMCRISNKTPEAKNLENADRLHQADRFAALITQQLNPSDKSGIDEKLIKHLNFLVKAADQENGQYRTEERKFIRHSQFMLKRNGKR